MRSTYSSLSLDRGDNFLRKRPVWIVFGAILAVVISLGLFFSMSYAATADIEHRLYVSADGVTPFDATTWDEVNSDLIDKIRVKQPPSVSKAAVYS